jgi:hypothetical protein
MEDFGFWFWRHGLAGTLTRLLPRGIISAQDPATWKMDDGGLELYL